jgi:diguanylate cyclase (GGDEF)-like protein
VIAERQCPTVLSSLAATLASEPSPPQLLDDLVAQVVELLPVSGAGLTLISTTRAPHYVAASDTDALCFEQLQTELLQGPAISAYAGGEPVLIPDLRGDDRYPRFAPAALAGGLGAVFAFPLGHGKDRVGALDLYRAAAGDLAPGDLEISAALAEVAAAHLLDADVREEARRTSDRVRHGALHDALTGLPNRIVLQERLAQAAARSTRSPAHAAVLSIDLDHFAVVNDEHGHHVGDQLLLAVARRLTGGMRTGDLLVRLGGGEFILLCEDLTDPSDAHVIAERMQRCLGEPFVLAGHTVTISGRVGLANVIDRGGARPARGVNGESAIDTAAFRSPAIVAGPLPAGILSER